MSKRHQHTVRNYVHIPLTLSLHFYFLYLLLNSCDENDATPAILQAAPHCTWESISQNVIDEAVDQWQKRFRAFVKVR